MTRQRLKLPVAEFSDAGFPRHPRKKALLIVVPQCGYGQAEQRRYLTDSVHTILRKKTLNLKSGSCIIMSIAENPGNSRYKKESSYG